MTDSEHLTIGKLVWAKVDPYPWWPGKILKTILQESQVVYKISFFADPTYTYLHRRQITPFFQDQPSPNDSQYHQPVLQQAVRMAYAYISKQKNKTVIKAKEPALKTCFETFEQQKVKEESEQKYMIPEQREGMSNDNISPSQEHTPSHTHIDDVNAENVIQVLEQEQRKQKKINYCYQTRKEEIRYHDKLKEKLLQRYNLLNFSKKIHKNDDNSNSKPIIKITVNNQKLWIQKKKKKICKSQNNRYQSNTSESIRIGCLKKINSILKNSKEDTSIVRQQSIEIMKRIFLLADNNPIKLKSLFVTLLKIVSSASSSLSSQQRLGDFKLYLERLQNEKGEDQEGSKLTQIDNLVN